MAQEHQQRRARAVAEAATRAVHTLLRKNGGSPNAEQWRQTARMLAELPEVAFVAPDVYRGASGTGMYWLAEDGPLTRYEAGEVLRVRYGLTQAEADRALDTAPTRPTR